MAEYTMQFINEQAQQDPKGWIEQCEQAYQHQIAQVAEMVVRDCEQKPIILVNGPSSSGKTTTTERLCRALAKQGIRAHMVSMDDYYRTMGTYDIPWDEENGRNDLESPECMDLALLSEHFTRLAAGEEIVVPRFDFETGQSIMHDRTLRLAADEVALIEGIHAFNPVIMGELAQSATGVYLSVASGVLLPEGTQIAADQLRFLRRAMRDSLFRNAPVRYTLEQWKSVRRGERLYITPYRGHAKLMVDTFLPYEVCIFTQRLQQTLLTQTAAVEQAGLSPLLTLLKETASIDYLPYMPETSVLHEFIG